MLHYIEINPVALQIGPLAVHWYGLMYLVGFSLGWAALALRIKHSRFPRGFSLNELSDIVFYIALGTIIGGRLGYMLFYARPILFENPLAIFEIWNGGMSFHGGLIGVVVAFWWYAKKNNKSIGDVADFIAPAVPIGLAAGRMGNFINGELWGRVTDVSWAMVFPNGGPFPRHPSQLYEFFLEGVLLFFILWMFSIKPRPRFAVSGLFLICYGCIRFFIEFFREPDIQMGFIAFGWLTEGQLLSIPMILIGSFMFIMAYVGRKKHAAIS